MDAIVNIDFSSGRLNWIIGDPEGWPEDMKKYFFTLEGEGFGWQYEQHACIVTPDGDVMCFDNGHYRSKVKEKYIPNPQNYSRAVRYRINTEDMTIRQVWEYGRERGQHFFSKFISNVKYLGEGHYIVHSGGIQERDGEAMEEFAIMFPGDPAVTTGGVTLELIDDKVMMELRTRGNSYRAEKLRLYHDGDNLPLGGGRHLGGLAETPRSQPQSLPLGGAVPGKFELSVVDESDRFTVNGTFENGQSAAVVLRGGEGDVFYGFTAERMPFNTVPGSETACTVQKAVNKQGLSGTYGLMLAADGALYDCGADIRC